MNPIRFEKNYTRDTTIIIQQIWAQEFSRGFREKMGWENPHAPTLIHFVNQGSIEIWDNPLATKWIMDKLFEKNVEVPGFIDALLTTYNQQLAQIKDIIKTDSINTPEEFKAYLKLMREGMYNFNTWYYIAINEKTPKDIHEKTLAVRKDDAYFAENDIFIRKVLRKLYPDRIGLEAVILEEEVSNPPSKEILEQRLKGFGVIDGSEYFTGTAEAFAQTYPEYNLVQEKIEENITSIKGQVAFKGKVQGRVRVLRRREEVGNVLEGEIIVSPMTTPDFTAALEKAAAIVTDEGGITCHAAIVARELKKPCIIGTKIATKVLKDGMEVQVDGEKGIVTILN